MICLNYDNNNDKHDTNNNDDNNTNTNTAARRICRLLYLKIRPVFVFDGPPPALKRRTPRPFVAHFEEANHCS